MKTPARPRTTKAETSKRVFISWSGETGQVAQQVGSWLERHVDGLQVWVSSLSIKGGADWNEELRQALARVDAALVCVGPSALRSPWVMYEIGAIGHTRPLVPLLLHVVRAELPDPLRMNQAIEAFPHVGQPATGDVGDRLLDAVADALGVARPSGECGSLDDTLAHFDEARCTHLRTVIERSEGESLALAILRLLAARSWRPKSLVRAEELGATGDRKHRVALTLLYLREAGLVALRDFDSVKSGTLHLTDEGRRTLMLFEPPR